MNILYSDISAVRSVLGLSEKELPIENVQGLDLQTLVELEIDLVYPDHAVIFSAVGDDSATSQQQKIFRILKLFCAYQAAVFLLPQFQLLVVQQVSDGDAENRRFSPNDLETTKAQIRGRLSSIRETLNPESYTVTAVIPILAATPSYDPVTNEGA